MGKYMLGVTTGITLAWWIPEQPNFDVVVSFFLLTISIWLVEKILSKKHKEDIK